MRGKRSKEEQIIAVLKEAQAGVGVQELCRKSRLFYNIIYIFYPDILVMLFQFV